MLSGILGRIISISQGRKGRDARCVSLLISFAITDCTNAAKGERKGRGVPFYYLFRHYSPILSLNWVKERVMKLYLYYNFMILVDAQQLIWIWIALTTLSEMQLTKTKLMLLYWY